MAKVEGLRRQFCIDHVRPSLLRLGKEWRYTAARVCFDGEKCDVRSGTSSKTCGAEAIVRVYLYPRAALNKEALAKYHERAEA